MSFDLQSSATASFPQSASRAEPASSRLEAASRWPRRILGMGLIAGIAIAAAFASGAFSGSTVDSSLLTHTIGRQSLDVTISEQGTLQSAKNVEIRCKVRGATNTLTFVVENGTQVKAGDVLARIDPKAIEDAISTQRIAYQTALATHAQSQSDVAIAEINIKEYLEGTFRSELKTKEKDVAIAKGDLATAENIFKHAEKMFRKGFTGELELESKKFAYEEAQLNLQVKETDLDVLTRYTKEKKLQELGGILKAKQAKLASDAAAVELEKSKLDREIQQLAECVITADRSGMVVYPENQRWEEKPDIREGATVRQDQVILLMPDLENMEVKFGVHEAKIDSVKLGMPATVQIQDRTEQGTVNNIASMAVAGGWWNGNMVKYDSTIKLGHTLGLKPGMSAKVEIFFARHKDIPVIPVAAVVEQEGKFYCWLKTRNGLQRREITIGDSDNQFIELKAGVKEGDEVVINPLAHIDEAQREALRPISGLNSSASTEKGKSEKSDAKKAADNKTGAAPAKDAQSAGEKSAEPAVKPDAGKEAQPATQDPANTSPQASKQPEQKSASTQGASLRTTSQASP